MAGGAGDAEEDRQQREEELAALSAIYGDALEVQGASAATIALPGPSARPRGLVLRLHLPSTYPSRDPPVYELESDAVPEGLLAEWAAEMDALFCCDVAWWAAKLLSGEKTVEVRQRPLPDHLLGAPILLAATTGPDGQAALGDSVAAGQPGGELVGWVTFSSLKDYGSAAQFNADVARHCVTADSPYAWREGVTQRLFGWEVLFTWVELLRERWEELTEHQRLAEEQAAAAAAAEAAEVAEALEAAALQEERTASGGAAGSAGAGGGRSAALEAAMAELGGRIVHGEPFTEKRSTFQAHLAPATSMEQVEAFMEILLHNNKIRQATHNIMAYRIERAASTAAGASAAPSFLQDWDDDGEDAAGGRLLHMMQLADCRNVVVVVSRWYGGILLGPARFAHINNAACQLLDSCGYIGGGGSGGGKKGKRK
eukprot:scaffold6.g2656.t1